MLPEDEVELAEETSSAKLIPYQPEVFIPSKPLQLLKDPLAMRDGRSLCRKDGLQLSKGFSLPAMRCAPNFALACWTATRA